MSTSYWHSRLESNIMIPYPSIIVHPNSILKPTDFLIFDETVFIFGADMPLNITNGEDRGH